MLAGVVRVAARRFGDAPALIPENGPRVSYADLDRRSDETAAGLSALGIGEGGVVALLLPSGIDYVIAAAAVAKLGAAPVGVNPRLAPPERRVAVEAVAPDLCLVAASLAEGVPAGVRAEALPSVSGGSVPALAPNADRVAAIVLTSGTTGAPRAAVFAERQLGVISAMDWGDRWGGGPPMLVATEMAHIGFSTKLPWYLMSGGPMHLLERWTPAQALRVIAANRIPVVGGIAAQIALLLRDPGFDDHDLSEVRTVVAGGGPSPATLVMEARERFGAGYSIRYSSTESGGLGTMTDPDSDDPAEIASVGRARPGIDVEVRDGEVWLRSPAVMSEYRGDAAATAETLVDGWLRTGDLGSLDDRGRLVITGRTSERYRRGGYFVSPSVVEAILREHPLVSEVAVVARPDPVMGETGVAVVVPADPSRPPALEDLRAFARDRLAAFELPEDLRVVGELPRTTMHKVDRRALASALAEHP